MNKRIAVIMPTRSAGGLRNASAQEAFASWKSTSEGLSDFYYGVDFDDSVTVSGGGQIECFETYAGSNAIRCNYTGLRYSTC